MSSPNKRHLDPERAASRRRQVLDAAASCFRRSGFHGASMAEISKEAGMSAGHIYNYFDGKDAIIASFVDDNVERVSALIRDLESHPDPLQKILDDVDLKVRENLDPSHWVLPLEIFAEASRNPKIAAAVLAADRRVREPFRAICKAGRIQHGLDADDALLDGRIETIISMYQGLQLRALHHPGLDVPALVTAFRHALRALLFT
jgi:AcrR family transcriptional regulator